MINRILRRLITARWLQHLIFWLAAWYVLLHIFSGSSSFQKIDYIYTSIFTISLLIPVLLNQFVFIPRLLNPGKYILYFLVFLINLAGFSLFNQLLFNHIIDFILPGYYFISYYSFFDIIKFFSIFLVLTSLIHLSKEWFELNESRHRIVLLEKEKIDAELKALMNQVNPHFLFNSLNVLYSLAIKKRKETPEAILKLSEILRYVIYDSNTDFVDLESEINLIDNFIELQSYRIGKDAKISFTNAAQNTQAKIAPMLFLPLLENAYKHGIKGDIEDTFIEMHLNSDGEHIHFQIKNNKGQISKNTDGGVGLANIKNRLALLYPDKYNFSIEENERTFKVDLKISL